jgi:hypothetical protein
MKPAINERQTPLALNLAIDQLYAAFDHYNAPKYMLDVCLGCCMNPQLEKEMRTLALRQLTANHFYQYNDSAKSPAQPPDEIKYFLPRMLELLAQGAQLHHSTELYLQRMGNCDSADYSAAERRAIDQFALAFFADGLGQHPSLSDNRFAGSNAFDILLMFDLGGVPLAPLLDYWLKSQEPASTLHYAESSFWDFWKDHAVHNAFANDRAMFCETMASWMLNIEHRQQFAQKILALDLENIEPVKTCGCCSSIQMTDIVESVFDSVAC